MTGWLRRFGDAGPRVVAAALAGAAVVYHGTLVLTVATGRFLKYPLAARGWLDGSLDVERWIDFSPLLFHVAVLAERVGDSVWLLTWLQILLVGAACGLTFLLLEPRFGRLGAVLGAAVLALDRGLVLYGRLIEPEVWLLVLVLTALVCLDRDLLLAAGVALALGVAVRPTVLPLALLAPLWLAVRPERRVDSLRAFARTTAPILVPCLAMLVLLAWRAQHAAGSWRTQSMNPGTVFFEGNQPASRGVSAEYPQSVRALSAEQAALPIPDVAHADYRRVARAERPELSVAGVNEFWFAKARAFVADEPVVAVRRSAAKLLYAFHGFAWHDVPEAWRYDLRLPWLPAVPFGVLAALALVGMASEARRWRSALMLYALVGCQVAVMLCFYVSARQRLVLLPALVYFAACAVAGLADRSAPSRRRLLTGVLAASLALALSLPTGAMGAETYQRGAWLRTQSAQAALGRAVASGDRRAVDDWSLRLVAAAGRHLDGLRPAGVSTARAAELLSELPASGEFDAAQAGQVRLDAAWLWLDAGRPDPALGELRSGGAPGSDPELAWLTSRALALSGDRDGALHTLDAAIARHPGRLELLAEWYALEDVEMAAAQASLDRYWSRADSALVLGTACFVHGRSDAARQALAPLAEAFPELHAVSIRLAIAEAESGSLDAGARRLVAAYSARPLPVVEPVRAARVLREWLAAEPDDEQAAATARKLLPLLRVPSD